MRKMYIQPKVQHYDASHFQMYLHHLQHVLGNVLDRQVSLKNKVSITTAHARLR